MKRFFSNIVFLLALSVPALSHAQIGDPYEMSINGVKVIVHPSGNDIIVIQAIIKGGVQNYASDKQGIESLAMTALTETGTAKDDKNSFKDKLDRVSAQMGGSTAMDFASFRLNCIKSDLDVVWPLFIDALTTPRYEEKEFQRIKQDAINFIRANESNPDFAIDLMARKQAFAGKDYSKDPNGTVESVNNLTAEETKKYWHSILTRSKMVIVVVGDLPKQDIEQKMKALLEKIPAGAPFKAKREDYNPAANTFTPQQKDNATNYIQGITGGPQPGTPDFNAFVLAMRIFSTRHFLEVRSKNGLSYAPGVWFSAGTTPYSNFYVTTTEPNKYIALARALIDKVKKDGFSAQELKNEKTGYLTGLYYRNETNDALASALASNEVIHGNWKRAINIKEDIKKVTLADLNRVFKRYITNITWSYQGDPSKVNAVMYTQKETPPFPKDLKAF